MAAPAPYNVQRIVSGSRRCLNQLAICRCAIWPLGQRPVRPAAPKTNSQLNCVFDPEWDGVGAQAGQPILVGSGPLRGAVRHTLSGLLKPSPAGSPTRHAVFSARSMPQLPSRWRSYSRWSGRRQELQLLLQKFRRPANDPIGRFSMRMSSHPSKYGVQEGK